MLRSTTLDNFIDACTTVEQIVDLCVRCLYNRNAGTEFIVTGINTDGSQIFAPAIDHWAGGQLIGEQRTEQQVVITFSTQVGINHKQSTTPWLEVLPIGDPGITPNGPFA